MKILILQDDFPPQSTGGAEMASLNLALGLKKSGNDVYLLTIVPDKKNVGQEIFQGIKIIRIVSNYHDRWRAYLSLYNPQTVKKVKRIIKEIQPDIVHAHNIHCHLSYYSLKIAKKYARAVFLTAHDVMSFHYGKLDEFINENNLSIPEDFNYKVNFLSQIKKFKKRYNPFRNIIIKHYLKYADKIFAVSFALKKALNQNGIKNVEVIYNGINIDEWQINNNQVNQFKVKYNLLNKKLVFFGGRLNRFKGGEKIIEAMELVVKKIPESLLLVTTKNDNYFKKITNLAKEKGIEIVATGWLKKDELKIVYHSANLIVTPSLCLDTFNMINLEAMVCHKPVVGTCFGGIPEVVQDNVTGYIVNPLNINNFANKILDLLINEEKSKIFGENGFQRAKEFFSLEKQIKETLNWYKKSVK